MSETVPELTEEHANHVLGLIAQEAARTHWAGTGSFEAAVAEHIDQAGDYSDQAVLDAVAAVDQEWRQKVLAHGGAAPVPQATGDGAVPAEMLAQLDPGHYRRVTYANGSQGVEEPGEVLAYFDGKGIKLSPEEDRRVRAGNLTELEIAQAFARAGHPDVAHELIRRKAQLKQASRQRAPHEPNALDRAGQRRAADLELRRIDPDAYRQQVAERNRASHYRHLTDRDRREELIDQINNPMGRPRTP